MVIKRGTIISVCYQSKSDIGTEVVETNVHTISVVDEVKDNKVHCSHSICSVDNKPFSPTNKVMPGFDHEYLKDVEPISSREFDMVIDSKLVPKKALTNVK